jgi:hypothetical protein
MFIYGSGVLKSGVWRGGGVHEAMKNVFFMVPECIEKGWLASQWRIFAEICQDLPADRTNYLAGRSIFAR